MMKKFSTATVTGSIVEEKIKDDFEKLDERTFLFKNEAKNLDIYVLAYSRFSLSLVVLKNLKDAGQWNVIKHPYIFNFLNETLLNFTYMHIGYICLHLLNLYLIFSTLIHEPTVIDLFLATILFFSFVFILLVQAALKHEREQTYGKFLRCYCFWIAYGFSLFTYFVTIIYFWFPTMMKVVPQSSTTDTIYAVLALLALTSSLALLLRILRNSPFGIYIIIMSKMIKHFIKVAIIWVLLLLCFAFCFQIITEGKHPSITHSPNATSEAFLSEAITKFFHVGNHISDYEIFERKFYKAFQLVTIIILITLAISKDFRSKAENEILRIKTNFCIEALHLSLKMDVVDDKVPFYRSQVNNVLVIDRYNQKTYSTYVNLSKLKALKAITQKGSVKKRVRFPSIEDIPPSDFLTSADKIDFSPNQDVQFIQELENMTDNESILTKFKRWFSCLDWKTHLNPANPKYYIIPRKIPV